MSQGVESKGAFKGRVGVFYGGSSGTGLTAAIEFQRLGGDVILGASSESTFRRALANVRFAGGDRASIRPLIGDVTDEELLQKNIQSLGREVTDIFYFAATGMPFAVELDRDFLGPMNRIVQENPPNADELLEEKKAQLRRQYAIWLPASRDQAVAVNYQAKINIINGFLCVYEGSQPLSFIDLNSTFGKEGGGPGFYGNVLTKYDFSFWLHENANGLAERGMDTAEFIAPVIEDTDVGKYLLTRVTSLLKPELAAVMIRTRIRRINVFKAMRTFLEMSRKERAREDRPYERYIVGDHGNTSVVKVIPDELRMDSSQFDI